MSSTPNLSPIENLDPFVLTAANPIFRQDITAEFIIILSADEDFDVYLNKAGKGFRMGGNDFFKMPLGDDGKQSVFTYIEFRRKAGATVANNTVTVVLGSGDYRRGTFTLAAVVALTTGATVKQTPAATLETPGDQVMAAAANTLIIAANANRRRAMLFNNDAANAVRIATNAADLTVGKGFLLQPKSSEEFHVSGALYGRPVAGTPSIVVSEEVF
jgi:hypothetical protein